MSGRRAAALWFTLCLGIIASPVYSQGDTSLIPNGTFEQGLEFWTVQQPCSSCWIDVLSVMGNRHYLSWERTESGGNGSAIGVGQVLDIDVTGFSSLTLSAEVIVDSHTLTNSGWWSDENSGSGEYPAKLVLSFAGANGELIEWSFGFLNVHDGSTSLGNFQVVPPGDWAAFAVDLFAADVWVDPRGAALPKPARLTGVWIGGSGWDFRASLRNLSLVAAGGGGSGGGTGAEASAGLIVEEYPLVSALEDTPDHFEFRQRVTPEILAARAPWRESGDPAAQAAATNAVIGAWGYSLEPASDAAAPAYALRFEGGVLVPDITHLFPLAVNDAGTDFRLIVESATEGLLVVLPGTVGRVDSAHFAGIAPVFVGNDVIEVSIDWDTGQCHVLRGGTTVYTYVPDGPFVEPPAKSLWSWGGHWMLQVEDDVLVDGASGRAPLGYDEIFGWQLIAGKPFFFFRQGETIRMSYAGQVVEPYPYEEVVHHLCCEPSMFNVSGNGTMVWFYALRDGTWTYVEAGVYN